MEVEDYQKKYANKELIHEFDKIPLAADAAHLFVDYLDTLCIEFTRRGLLEPYQVTKQYEEILSARLSNKGTNTKLTYDVVSNELENLGPPRKVADEYIKENNPQLKPLLTKNYESEQKKVFDIDDDIRKKFMVKGIQFLSAIILLSIFVMNYFGIILMIATLSEGFFWENFAVGVVIGALAFISYDFGTAIFNYYPINENAYQKVRPHILTSFVATSTIGTIESADFDNILLIIVTFSALFILYILSMIRQDLTNHQSLETSLKKFVRFLLPSYLLTALAFLATYGAIFWMHDESKNVGVLSELMLIPLILALLSLVPDISRKYPVSIHRQITIAFIPFSYLWSISYRVQENFDTDGSTTQTLTLVDQPVLFIIFVVWYLLYGILMSLIYKKEISSELSNLRSD